VDDELSIMISFVRARGSGEKRARTHFLMCLIRYSPLPARDQLCSHESSPISVSVRLGNMSATIYVITVLSEWLLATRCQAVKLAKVLTRSYLEVNEPGF
jgi:hypothetical protein